MARQSYQFVCLIPAIGGAYCFVSVSDPDDVSEQPEAGE
jgi:hypothetical protein